MFGMFGMTKQTLDISMTYDPLQGKWESVTTMDGKHSLDFHSSDPFDPFHPTSTAASVSDPGLDLESLSLEDSSDQKGFAVMFKEDCPHLASALTVDKLVVDVKAPCEVCSNVGENWLCLGCSKV